MFTPNPLDFCGVIVCAGSDGTTHWNLSNLEDEGVYCVGIETYGSLAHMLEDTDRFGVFISNPFGFSEHHRIWIRRFPCGADICSGAGNLNGTGPGRFGSRRRAPAPSVVRRFYAVTLTRSCRVLAPPIRSMFALPDRLAAAAVMLGALCLSACGSSQEARITHGAELAQALGCADCHSPDFTGHKVSRNDQIAVLYSSNLTRVLPNYSDAAFKTVLTTGVRPDGSRLWYMDAAPYAVLADTDRRDLLTFLRTLKPNGLQHPRIKTTPAFDALVRTGAVKPESATLAADLANPPRPSTPPNERGRYLARIYCAGCHAPSLRGFTPPQPGDPPDLAAAAAYTKDDFRALLAKGQGLDGHAIGEMAEAAKTRFSRLPVADVDAIHDYLSRWARTRSD